MNEMLAWNSGEMILVGEYRGKPVPVRSANPIWRRVVICKLTGDCSERLTETGHGHETKKCNLEINLMFFRIQ